MKLRKLLILCIVALAVAAGTALADSARVLTPGGPVNLRRRASTKTSLMARMPVGSRVTVLESYSVWSRVLYQKKDGWVMTKFLKSR